MKALVRSILYAALTAIVFVGLQACNSKETKQGKAAEKYTCPMHPQVVQDAPGTCPVCKMDLVKVNSTGDQTGLMLSESQIQLANISTIKAGSGNFSTSKIISGRLAENPQAVSVISSRFAGRIEKLFVSETGGRISKGQPLMQVYSEQLQVLQQDYLLQLKQAEAFPHDQIYKTLRDAARNKLVLFGYTNAQMNALRRSGRVAPSVTVYADRGGVVNQVSVTEGQYVEEGAAIMQVQDYDSLWLEAEVYPAEAQQVNLGMVMEARVNGFPDLPLKAKISFINPQLNPSAQTLTIRATVANPEGNLQPGMQATVFLPSAKLSNAVSLPIDAVIRNEAGSHVWIKKGNNTFEPRKVSTGAEDAAQIVVTSGIENGEEVVTSGAYLLYSEFVLKKGAEPLTVK